ncbi:hypothetical protein DUI87_18426 [Hirundo rustica rustica]|uniref:Uncharacterized protein n=1 Tax=Hirundo rustica rustica TaxID=333673 RepID=A0A3M0JW16_HIRRU|nr:hypothetical protein DUI87_18426 [Hirundo rustica rustica]
MENGAVYNETTEPEAKAPRRRLFGCTLRRLQGWRLAAKVVQAVFGFFATFAFAAEFGIEFYLRRKQNISGRSENPGEIVSDEVARDECNRMESKEKKVSNAFTYLDAIKQSRQNVVLERHASQGGFGESKETLAAEMSVFRPQSILIGSVWWAYGPSTVTTAKAAGII